MSQSDKRALARMFTEARSHNGWLADAVGDDELERAYDIAKFGPTSMNSQPMRLVFLRSTESRERLKLALSPGNVEKAMSAPVLAILAYDTQFYTELPKVFPHNPNASAYFTGNPDVIEPTAFRNASMQAAYYLLALRAVGLDVGPMSGFDPAAVNAAFFADSSWRVNLICGIGHGDPTRLFSRSPRLDFAAVSRSL